MRRREFLALLAGLAAAGPGRAQSPDRTRRVGVIIGIAESDPEGRRRLTAFREALKALGWAEGRNLDITVRWAAGDAARAQAVARDLIQMGPEVVLASSGPAVAALQGESSRVPVVFVQLVDPVGRGLVDSLARPGRNLTGLTNFEPTMGGKWLQLLKELAPATKRVGFLYNAETAARGAGSGVYVQSFESFAAALTVQAVMMPARNASEVRQAIETFAREPEGALLVPPDISNTIHRGAIIEGAAVHRLPAIFPYRYYVVDGGLMSYGVDPAHVYRGAAAYVDGILRGESAAEMPVQQPTSFELLINLKTAAALGFTIPPTLLARADEVIE